MGHQEEVYVQNSSPIVRAHVPIKYISCKDKLTNEN